MKPLATLRRLLVSTKDKVDLGEGVATIGCSNCEKQYIGETKRKLKTRVKEHSEDVDKLMEGRAFTRGTRKESETDRWKSAIMDHAIKENHVIDWKSAKIGEKEVDWGKRGIK